MVNGAADLTKLMDRLEGFFDMRLVDCLVNLTGRVVYDAGDRGRAIQTGKLRNYLMFLAVALVGLFAGVFAWITWLRTTTWRRTGGGRRSRGDHPAPGRREIATPGLVNAHERRPRLLTSLWLLPLIGIVIVLLIPKRNAVGDPMGGAGLHDRDLRRVAGRRWRTT